MDAWRNGVSEKIIFMMVARYSFAIVRALKDKSLINIRALEEKRHCFSNGYFTT